MAKAKSPADDDKQTMPQPAADKPADNSVDPKPESMPKTDPDLVDGKFPTSDDPGQQPIAGKAGGVMASDIVKMAYTGTAEVTFAESAYHPDSLKRPYNPDPLVQRDQTYKIYEDMLDDDQVDVAMAIKKTLVVGSGWYIEVEDEAQDEIKQDLEIALGEQCDRPFADILEELCQGFEYGFACGEKIFKNREDGSLCLKDVKVRHPATWLFHTDRRGNIIRYEQRGLYSNLPAVDPDSLIHIINNPKHQNAYGRSDLRAAYAAYIAKRHIVRMYAIFMEKAASPTPVAKYDRRAPPEVVTDIMNVIKKFQTKTAIVIPKEFEVEFLEAKNTGDAFIKGINLFNMLIGRALFIPDLLGFQGSETGGGSYSLGKDQIGMIFRHIYRRRETIQRAVDMHMIRPMCMYNWGMTDGFPKFKFKLLSDEEATKSADMWLKAINGKTWKPSIQEVNHFRSILKFPESDTIELYENDPLQAGGVDENGDPIPPGEPGSDPGGDPGADGKGNPADAGADDPAGNKQASQAKGAGGKGGKGQGLPKKGSSQTDGKDAKNPKGQGEKSSVKKNFSITEAADKLHGNFQKKVNFAMSDNLMRATVHKIVSEAQPIVADILEDLYDQVQKKKIVAKQDLSRADSIQLKYLKGLQMVFKKNFRRLYEDAKIQAATEVKKGSFAKGNIPEENFLEFLEQETFKYIGDWEYMITRKTKDELVRAIKDGKPLSEVVSVMDNEGNDMSEASLERFARTKGTEVYNRGRVAYFESTGIVSAYQFAAILDDRTSDICDGLNGCIFEKEDAPVPPMHFNCRSMLVPITQFETYEADKEANNGQDIDKFIEDNIGKGFPKE